MCVVFFFEFESYLSIYYFPNIYIYIYARLFPLVGGLYTPTALSSFYGLSIHDDDNEFEVIQSPRSAKELKQFNYNNDDNDDEKASTIVESEDTNDNNNSPRIRHNSIPATISTFKTAILNGISVDKQ